jgi:hypothetical protein
LNSRGIQQRIKKIKKVVSKIYRSVSEKNLKVMIRTFERYYSKGILYEKDLTIIL